MSGPYQRWNLSNCGTVRLCVAIDCGVLSVNNLKRNGCNIVDR